MTILNLIANKSRAEFWNVWQLQEHFRPFRKTLALSVFRVIFHSTNERSHSIKDNTLANLNNSILLKSVSFCYCYFSATNGIFRSESILSFASIQLLKGQL